MVRSREPSQTSDCENVDILTQPLQKWFQNDMHSSGKAKKNNQNNTDFLDTEKYHDTTFQ